MVCRNRDDPSGRGQRLAAKGHQEDCPIPANHAQAPSASSTFASPSYLPDMSWKMHRIKEQKLVSRHTAKPELVALAARVASPAVGTPRIGSGVIPITATNHPVPKQA